MLHGPTPLKLLLYRVKENLLLHIKFVWQYSNINIEADFVTDHRYHCITMKEDKEHFLLWQLRATGIRYFPLIYVFFFQR